jgi:hypothetical protein
VWGFNRDEPIVKRFFYAQGAIMTIRQIAETSGSGINTVRRIGKMMYPEVKADRHGLPIDYNRDQSIKIMDKLPKRNYIADPTQMGTQVGAVDQMAILQFMAQMQKQQQDFMKEMLHKVDSIAGVKNNNKIALPAPQKSDKATLRQLVNKYASSTLDGDYREAWNNLYEELYYRESVNIRTRAKNQNITKLDCIADLKLIDSSIAIVKELMG